MGRIMATLGPHEHFILEDMEFEAGRLVKIGGYRPEYMDGHTLIRIVGDLACRLAVAKRELAKLEGGTGE
jgi:hypothetical protein